MERGHWYVIQVTEGDGALPESQIRYVQQAAAVPIHG